MRKKHQFHRENCANTIREAFKDMFDRTIVLAGKHAFEWSITVCDGNTFTKMTYSCSKKVQKTETARKEFEQICPFVIYLES